MRGENGTESLVGFFFKCRNAMVLGSVLLIRIGKQNVEIIDTKSKMKKVKMNYPRCHTY